MWSMEMIAVRQMYLYHQIITWGGVSLGDLSLADIPPLIEQSDRNMVVASVSHNRYQMSYLSTNLIIFSFTAARKSSQVIRNFSEAEKMGFYKHSLWKNKLIFKIK